MIDSVDKAFAFAAIKAIIFGRFDDVLLRFDGAVKARMSSEEFAEWKRNILVK